MTHKHAKRATDGYSFYQKLDSNCPDSEKSGSGPGSCSGGADKQRGTSESHMGQRIQTLKNPDGTTTYSHASGRAATVGEDKTGKFAVEDEQGRIMKTNDEHAAHFYAKTWAAIGSEGVGKPVAETKRNFYDTPGYRMGQRQIEQAKARGEWRGNPY